MLFCVLSFYLSEAVTDDFKTAKKGLWQALRHHASEARSKWTHIEVCEFFNRLHEGRTGSIMVLFITEKDKRVMPGLIAIRFVATADEWLAKSCTVERANSTMGVCGR